MSRYNQENDTRTFFFDLIKRKNLKKCEIVKQEDYIKTFETMRGSVAKFEFKPQIWVNDTLKKIGVKYILTKVEFIPFNSKKTEHVVTVDKLNDAEQNRLQSIVFQNDDSDEDED